MPKVKEAINIIALCGLVPQVVTETIWALLSSKHRINSLHIITTQQGYESFYNRFVRDSSDWINLWDIFDHEPILPKDIFFYLIGDSEPHIVKDILSGKDHAKATRLIGNKIYDLTRDNMPPLHASAAGGRKTMSMLLAMAMSLHARQQDRLSHVLVSPDIEKERWFAYPKTRNIVPPSYIELIDVPFPRLKNLLADSSIPLSMDELINQLDEQLSDLDKIVVNVKARSITIKNKSVILPPLLMAVYLLFVQCKEYTEDGIEPRNLDMELMAKSYRLVGVDNNTVESLINRLSNEDPQPWLLEQISKLKRKMNNELGYILAAEAGIESLGNRPHTRYRLRAPYWRIVLCNM